MTKNRSRLGRLVAIAGTIATGGYLLAGPNTGCTSFLSETTLVAADFCFIFDCQNGLLGGTIDPCSGLGSGNQTVEGDSANPLFTDCPN